MDPLDLTGLAPIMARTCGDPGIVIGLIDGPVAVRHPDLNSEHVRSVPGRNSRCKDPGSSSCRHGTFIAGILHAKRNSPAPALAPGCTLLIRPVFSELEKSSGELPSATPIELAWAILDCIDEGARILNLSIALEVPSPEGDLKLTEALDYAAQKEVLVVVAAGNQGLISGSALTRHPWVIPVVACDLRGRLAAYSNMTGSIRRNGLTAPGEKITSLGTNGECARYCGTSTATPFVTGALALLWSEFPELSSQEIKSAITAVSLYGRRSISPPLLNAWETYKAVQANDFPGSTSIYGKKAA
jgi:subtilisin family serine protease